ncbi:MAG: GspE/PulE family protein [Pseudomonadota bacterium]
MSTEENQYPRITESLTKAEVPFPDFLEKNFARILIRVELLWGSPEAVAYIESLFLEDRPDPTKPGHSARTDRQGFPMSAVNELVLLKQIHQRYFLTPSQNPHDPFSGSDALLPIETPTNSVLQQSAVIHEPALQRSSDEGALAIDGHPDNAASAATLSTLSLQEPGWTSERRRSNERADWPIIHTQNELFESAKLQHNGENVYPLQDKPVGEILLYYGLMDEKAMRVVRNMQKKPQHKNQPIGEILIEIGIIKQEELTRALHIQAGVLMVDLLTFSIPPETLKIVPTAKAREKQVVPIGTYHDTLYLAVSNPFTFTDRPFFSFLTGLKIMLVFAPQHEIVNRLNLYGGGKSSIEAREEFRNLASKAGSEFSTVKSADEVSYTDISENDSTIIGLVNQLTLNAIDAGASDIHIELFPGSSESNIRFRRDGNLEHFSSFPSNYHNAVVSRIKIMASLDISEKRRPQDGKISLPLQNGTRVDLRVATIPALRGTEFVTIRILASGEPQPLVNMGMGERDMKTFRELFSQPYGLILVCGPTGSGKTTTLHSVLKELNTPERKIWTAEDPIEIVQKNLCQVQVNSKIGMTFAAILRSLLRADPDIIMIGEMRDQETSRIALEASMTGHLVLSTLHTNSAADTIARLIDLDIDPYNLSDALIAILAQRLARKICPACARREEASPLLLDSLATEYYQSGFAKAPARAERDQIIQEWRKSFGVDDKLYIMHPVGCKACNAGYKGRIGLYELLRPTPAMRALIRHQSSAAEYLAAGIADGMRTLKQDGIEKVIRGITDMVQVRSACI